MSFSGVLKGLRKQVVEIIFSYYATFFFQEFSNMLNGSDILLVQSKSIAKRYLEFKL